MQGWAGPPFFFTLVTTTPPSPPVISIFPITPQDLISCILIEACSPLDFIYWAAHHRQTKITQAMRGTPLWCVCTSPDWNKCVKNCRGTSQAKTFSALNSARCQPDILGSLNNVFGRFCCKHIACIWDGILYHFINFKHWNRTVLTKEHERVKWYLYFSNHQ